MEGYLKQIADELSKELESEQLKVFRMHSFFWGVGSTFDGDSLSYGLYTQGNVLALVVTPDTFKKFTRQKTLPHAVSASKDIYAVAKDLLGIQLMKTPQLCVRLLGIKVEGFASANQEKPLIEKVRTLGSPCRNCSFLILHLDRCSASGSYDLILHQRSTIGTKK
jgi:hypothetical protein